MNTRIRPIVSAAVFASLLGFLVISVVRSGVSSDAAVLAFTLLAVQGLIECAILSYRVPMEHGARMRVRLERKAPVAAGVSEPVRSVVSTAVFAKGRSRAETRRESDVLVA
ncbi:hypothetical protein ASA1KI_06030 [Opitutales bacterium ASA1]|uniref:hypothetical protein n=1 Tax=Congregicoccus parvus TaxID=3081749 RepID=UPI002B2ABAAA|nr:hypothetical protein ASA1KI_06030 [Opitutales bacterium ASA1]